MTNDSKIDIIMLILIVWMPISTCSFIKQDNKITNLKSELQVYEDCSLEKWKVTLPEFTERNIWPVSTNAQELLNKIYTTDKKLYLLAAALNEEYVPESTKPAGFVKKGGT